MILSLETSGNVCSVAIHENGVLIAADEIREKQAHASRLAVMIKELLLSHNLKQNSLKAVAVSSGPGSYTGLRIGASTAKGICYALSLPLISAGTLDIMIHQASKIYKGVSLCPMIDARRMEVYSMLVDAEHKIIQDVEAVIIDELSYRDFLDENKVVFFGDGASKCSDIIQHANAKFVDDIFPSAISLGELASEKFSRSAFEDLLHFEPFYLKEFQAKKPSRSLI